MNMKLVVVQGKPEGKEIPLRTPKFLIGRGTECHLRPNSELISRHHCMFLIASDQVTLRDLGSTNGTLVNGERLNGDVIICHEDLIQVGPLGFRMEIECPVPSDAAEKQPDLTVAAKIAATAVAAEPSTQDTQGAGQDADIDRWLVGDPIPGSPDAPSTDTNLTTVDLGDDRDTHHDIAVLPVGRSSEASTDEVVLESGRKKKVGNAKAKIEKTRDDTSGAAADILRRMMDRRRK